MKVALATAVALVLLASSSGAEPTFQCPMPGTVIAYSDGSSLTFTDQAGVTCRARTNRGILVPLFLGLILPGADLEKNQGERLLPLRVGSEIEFMSSSTTEHANGEFVNTTEEVYYDNSVKVVAQEKLVTAAGTFDTFVVELHRQVRGKWRGAWVATAWLASELGSTVKYKLETRQGYGSDTGYEIASLTVPRQGPAPVARAAPAPEARGATTEAVKLEQVGSLYLVPAQVNGTVTLNFVLDTGASDVAIPADVVQMLTRAGTISSQDFIGTRTYVIADGSKLPGEAFTLHELSVGSHTIKNVVAHVAPIQGRLLLGESFLSQLPTWTIDYKQHALVIGGSAGVPGATPTTTQVSAAARTPVPSAPVAPPVAPQPVPRVSPPLPASASPPPTPAPSAAVGTVPPVVASVSSPGADTAFHCPRTGTTVEYNNGVRQSFTGNDGFRCAFNDGAFHPRTKFAAFADDARFVDAGLGRLWPLQVGAEQAFQVAKASERFKVLRRETVTVVAGTFDTFVVEQEEAAPEQRAIRRYWVSTNLGLVVKSDFARAAERISHWGSGNEGSDDDVFLLPGDYEAVRITNPGR